MAVSEPFTFLRNAIFIKMFHGFYTFNLDYAQEFQDILRKSAFDCYKVRYVKSYA